VPCSVFKDLKVTVQTFLTLAGVMQAPGGPEEDPSDNFTHGGCQAAFSDPTVGEFVTEMNGHASAFLFGRRTFDIFHGTWPDETDPAKPLAPAISLPKYVVSNSLSEAERQIWGSGNLLQTLLRHELVGRFA
jgi:dihydrofolate reductase